MAEPIRIVHEDGTLLVRDGLVLAFFCKQPFHDMAGAVRAMFDAWLAAIPSDRLAWAMVGASAEEGRPMNARTLDRCRAQLDPAKAVRRDMTAFSVYGPEEYNPAYQFAAEGSRDIEDDDEDDLETNLVEMRFPTDVLQTLGPDAFVDLAVRLAEPLAYDSGYGSVALNWSVESDRRDAARRIFPLALRHPGFDVHMNSTTRYELGRRSRGARWLTFLGPALIDPLGGRDALAGQLDPGVSLREAGHGLLLRAGPEPTLGDVNRNEDLPLLRSVAQAIEPVTYFNDTDLEEHLFLDNTEALERWERRFLDE